VTTEMSDEERVIWRTAYGAAIAVEYVKEEEPARMMGRPEAALNLSAEVGIAAGDIAVRALRKWREDENAEAGIRLLDWTAPE
jgi:hypothetical protein